MMDWRPVRLAWWTLLTFLLCIPAVHAAPPDFQRLAALHSLDLPASGSASALYAPRLLVWPQLEKREDVLMMFVPGEKERALYLTEPLFTIGTVYGVAEGDWAVFTEIPKQAGSPDKPRLVAIYLPRGSIYKYPIPKQLDTRYAYAPRLFGFPDREGASFYWLALPASGAARFGTMEPDRGIANLTVDGPRLCAKTIDPKNLHGTSAIVYIWYGLVESAGGLPELEQVGGRTFPRATDSPYYDAEEAYFHPEYTILAGLNRRDGNAPYVALLPASAGAAKAIGGRILSFDGLLLTLLMPNDKINVVSVEKTGTGDTQTFSLRTRFELALPEASTLGKVVWITGAWTAGTQLALDLQVQLSGQAYNGSTLGTPVMAVWDMTTKQPVMQLAAVASGRSL